MKSFTLGNAGMSNLLRGCLSGVLQYASAQPLDFLELDKKSSFLNWKLASAQKAFLDGHEAS
ncbi:MAG: hypothetical protein ACQET7_11975 [Thermodesulfobacteriota bacterium]